MRVARWFTGVTVLGGLATLNFFVFEGPLLVKLINVSLLAPSSSSSASSTAHRRPTGSWPWISWGSSSSGC